MKTSGSEKKWKQESKWMNYMYMIEKTNHNSKHHETQMPHLDDIGPTKHMQYICRNANMTLLKLVFTGTVPVQCHWNCLYTYMYTNVYALNVLCIWKPNNLIPFNKLPQSYNYVNSSKIHHVQNVLLCAERSLDQGICRIVFQRAPLILSILPNRNTINSF